MVQLLCSDKVYDKLKQELSKYQIEIKPDSQWVLIEKGFEVPVDKLCIVFDSIDYMDVVRLLVSGIQSREVNLDTIAGMNENKYAVMEPRNVLYLEADSEGIIACTESNRYRIRETLQYYESLWAARGFVRINKSQLVNLLHVKEIVPWFNSRYVLRMNNGSELEVSKMFSKKLRHTLNL